MVQDSNEHYGRGREDIGSTPELKRRYDEVFRDTIGPRQMSDVDAVVALSAISNEIDLVIGNSPDARPGRESMLDSQLLRDVGVHVLFLVSRMVREGTLGSMPKA